MVAKQALSALTGAASKGVSVDAQIGDRNNTLGDEASIGDIEGETVSVDQGNSSFKGQAKEVVINESDYRMVFGALFIGIIMGWLFFKKPENIWKRNK